MKLRFICEQYACALRVIGQDLAELLPESLTIEMSGDNFIARGCGRTKPSESKADGERGLTRKFWQKLAERSPKAEPASSTFTRTYTPDEINKLDEIGRARRTYSAQRPDLHSLAERLRMIGRIVDEKNGELVNLSDDGNNIRFRYRDAQGKIHSEEYSNLTLYKLQQEYYSGRRLHPGDLWKGDRR